MDPRREARLALLMAATAAGMVPTRRADPEPKEPAPQVDRKPKCHRDPNGGKTARQRLRKTSLSH